MNVCLEGNGKFDFRIHLGRIEYDDAAPFIPTVPIDGIAHACLAVIILDDRHSYDQPNGVAAGVMLKGRRPLPAGWFQWKQARQYRAEIEQLGLGRDDAVVCLGKLHGGQEIQYKKGPKRMCFHLWLDLVWPIRMKDDWYAACAPFLRDREQG